MKVAASAKRGMTAALSGCSGGSVVVSGMAVLPERRLVD
jgi:hypothetical protein